MTGRIEFGSKEAADSFRDEYADHLCSDDDRRLKTVAISSNAPDYVLETATIEAGHSERGSRGGHPELTTNASQSTSASSTGPDDESSDSRESENTESRRPALVRLVATK